MVSLDFSEEINGPVEGKVVYGENLGYKLLDEKTAVLIEGSVFSEGEKIDDSYIDVKVDNGIATVSTNYRKAEYGFGKDYVGDEKVYYDINLSKLDLTAEEGRMSIRLIFEDSIIAETNSDLAVSAGELNVSEKNVSINAEPFALEDFSIYDLTYDEIKLLAEKAGTISVNTTKSEILNKRLVIKYELGDYWTEFSYDYDGKLSKELLDKIELERRYWLKNLAKELSRKISEAENVNDLIIGFKLNESNSLRSREINVSESTLTESQENQTEIPPTNPPTTLPEESNITNEIPIEESNETPAENTENNSEESTEFTPRFGITGQIVSQSESSINFFGRFKEFWSRMFG